jgi:hypothetical protein
MTENNNPLGMKSIAQAMTQSPVQMYKEMMKDAVNMDWFFSGWFQKGVITACFLWSVYSLGSFLWRLIA